MSSVSGSLTMARHSPADWEGGENRGVDRQVDPNRHRPDAKVREEVPLDAGTVLREVRSSVTRCSLLAELLTRRYIHFPSL